MNLPTSIVENGHRDFELLDEIQELLEDSCGSREKLEREIPLLLRRGLWEVIDTPRTARVWVSELEKTEKTYIGTKIEILIRDFFGFSRGNLDLRVGGHDVDVKNTVRENWMTPSEALGKVCLLVAEDDRSARCSFGQPCKWHRAPPASLHQASRCANFPRCDQGRRYMKRLRKNGGARDPLARKRIAVLSGKYDASLISTLGLPLCRADEFISHRAETEIEACMLKAKL